jgi:ornithine decarboxylase
VVNSALDEYFPDPELVRVIAEPGRFYVASAYILATNIHSKREILNGEDVTHIMYYINDGVYGSFNSLLYDHSHVTPIPLNVSYSSLTFCSITLWFVTVKTGSLGGMIENEIDSYKCL